MARDGLGQARSSPSRALRTFAGTAAAVRWWWTDCPPPPPTATEELKGPKASAPPQALEGFLRKTGLAREAARPSEHGVFYAVLPARPGRPTPEIAAELRG